MKLTYIAPCFCRPDQWPMRGVAFKKPVSS